MEPNNDKNSKEISDKSPQKDRIQSSQDEEEKITDDLSKLSIKDSNIPQNTQTTSKGKQYLFAYKSKEWKTVISQLDPISKGEANLEETVELIERFMNTFDPNPIRSDTKNLKDYLSSLKKNQQEELESVIFPGIATLVLRTPEIFPNSFSLLLQGSIEKVILSKEQCACLLANMFFCTTIPQKSDKLPHPFNFSYMFVPETRGNAMRIEKIRCVISYFRQVLAEERSQRFLEFHRLGQNEKVQGCLRIESWKLIEIELSQVEIKPSGKIEEATGAIEVDFANKFLGGGALRHGAAQEEILFITSPEHLVGMLFCEVMTEKEAILIKGAGIYCNYKGYLEHFAFVSDNKDQRPVTKEGVLDREVLAIDALDFRKPNILQFSEEGVLRELNKAYIGFFGDAHPLSREVSKPLATGKWGCGVFKGDTQLKFMIQWIAASRAFRKMIFYSFADYKGLNGVEKVLEHYKGKIVGEVVIDLLEACKKMEESKFQDAQLFKYLLEGKEERGKL